MRFLGFLTLILVLSACGWNPDYRPAGYTYHHEVYKAPPGPPLPGAKDADKAKASAKDAVQEPVQHGDNQ
jgi:hypothetical protein